MVNGQKPKVEGHGNTSYGTLKKKTRQSGQEPGETSGGTTLV